MAGANTLGKRLRWLRDARGETLKQVGDRAGVADMTISRIERGLGQSLNVATLIRLSRALRVEPVGLFLAALADQQPQPAPDKLEGEASQRPPSRSTERHPAKEVARSSCDVVPSSGASRHPSHSDLVSRP